MIFNIRFRLETPFATFLKSFLPGINLELSSLSKTNTPSQKVQPWLYQN